MVFSAKSVSAGLACLVMIPMLAGCETAPRKQGSSLSEPPVTVGKRSDDIIAPQPAYSSNEVDGALNVALSNKSVEVYTISGPPPAMAAQMDAGYPPSVSSVPSVMTDPVGMPLPSDPRVTVYPIGGDAGAYPQTPVYPAVNNNVYGTTPVSARPGVAASIYFPYGSSNLGGQQQNLLNNAAEAAKFAPVDRVSVEGYASPDTQSADPIKAKILNLKESMNRAAAVSQGLIERGVPAEKIKTVGWGDTKQSGGGKDTEQRVDIVTGGGY